MRSRNLASPIRRLVWLIGLLCLLPLTNLSAAVDRTKPTTPGNLRATAVTSTGISLAWNPSTDNSGSFNYTMRELNSGQTRGIAQTQTSYAWTGLQSSQTYRFVVFATDAAGNQSANSNTLTANTTANPPLAAPANFHVAGTGLGSVSLAWNAVGGASSYQLAVAGSFLSTGLQTSYTFDVSPATSYTFMVRAQAGSVFSPWSAALIFNTPADSTPPSVPTVTAVALSPGVVQLSWTESSDDSPNVGYNVYVNGAPARSMLPDNSNPRTVVIQNLHAATAYEFTVKAYDTTGNFSAASAPFLLTTPTGTDIIPPATPGIPVIGGWGGMGNGISSVAFMWNGSADNLVSKAYEIYMDGALVGEVLWDVHYPSLDNWFTVRRIPPGTTHAFTVKARDEAGNVSAASPALTVTLLPSTDTTAPSAPTLLWGDTSASCGFIDLSFNPATDDDPNGIEYEIYEDGLYRGMWRGEVFEASFGRHSYYMRAIDRAGNRSAPSNAIVLDSGLRC